MKNIREIMRRGFITRVAQGVLAGSVGEGLLKPASAQLRVPDPPGKKLGWQLSASEVSR